MDTNFLSAWFNYNKYFKQISQIMKGTKNIIGEFAENIACLYYKTEKITASQKSYDIIKNDGKKVQVKSRRLDKIKATKLNVIRNFDFDILLVILFSEDGYILKAIEMDVKYAKIFAKENKYQHGYIITTTNDFLYGIHAKDITKELEELLKLK